MGDGDDASQVLRSVVAGAFGGVTSCFSAAPFVSILSLSSISLCFIYLFIFLQGTAFFSLDVSKRTSLLQPHEHAGGIPQRTW